MIGDSHIGPLLYAVREAGQAPGVEATFFACHVDLLKGMEVSGHRIVGATDDLKLKWRQFSGGLDHIDVDRYDRFVIIGHGFWMGATLYIYKNFVSDSMARPFGEKYLISDACFFESALAATMRAESLRLAGLIRSIAKKPVTVVPSPNPGEGLAEGEVSAWYPPFYAALRNGDADVLAGVFRDVCQRIAARLGVTVIPPLAEVAANGLFNRREYCMLPPILDADTKVDRMTAMAHASDSYGVRLAGHIFNDGARERQV